jgi:hypothetical protein
MPTPTPTPSASPTPTSMPGPPSLSYPPDGALLPQPVSPNEWHFSWSARTGPCYSGVSIHGPGYRCLGVSNILWPYEFQYTSDRFLPDDALGPWTWSAFVQCPLGSNYSEVHTFWVEPAHRIFLPFIQK